MKKLAAFNKVKYYALLIWFRYLRYIWSAYRHRHSAIGVGHIHMRPVSEQLNGRISLPTLAQWVNSNFEYQADGLNKLMDSIDSPAQTFLNALKADSPLKDDCDGFHACLYQLVDYWYSNYDPHLLTLITDDVINSHTVLLLRLWFDNRPMYQIIDYTRVYQARTTLNRAIEDIYNAKYRNKTSILFYELSKWDKSKHRWVSVKKENF